MALDNNTQLNYTDKTTIKNWFKTGLKPTQTQFWATWDSYFHKGELIPISTVSGLGNLLDGKAETNHTHNQYATNDATSLTVENVLAWKNKLEVANLEFNDEAIKVTSDYHRFNLRVGASQSAFNSCVDQEFGLVIYKPIEAGTVTEFPYVVGINAEGNSAKLPAADLGKNFANTDLAVAANRKHTGTASVEFGMPFICSNASVRYSGILDKSADATFNALIGLDSGGNLSKVNGKTVFMNQPDNLTEAEKNAWKTKMNGGYSTTTVSVSVISPNVVKKGVSTEKNIILRGSNLSINPSSFSISILNSSKANIYTLSNSKVNLISKTELNFWLDLTAVPLNEDLFIKINNGIAEYITPISFQVRTVVNDIDFSVLAWSRHYKSDLVQSGIDYAEGINAGIEYDEALNGSLLGNSLVASFHSSNIPNILETDDFSITFNTSLQNLNTKGGSDSINPKVGIYIGDKPTSLSNSISYGVFYSKNFTQTNADSHIGMIGGGSDPTAVSSPVEAAVVMNKQGSVLTVSISFIGNTKFLVATFPFTPTTKIGFSMVLGGQLRRSNISIKNIQGYKY